jgi:glyoxylase-like metal-dependent hydrolase (beta-lactamase superfamily II)
MKRTFAITFLFFLLVNVSLAQPRNVYEIYAIEYAKMKSRLPVSSVAVGAKSSDSVSVAFYIWYLNGDNGRKILVDAGLVQDSLKPLAYLKDYLRPDLALQKINIKPNDVTDIIITHTHFDHIDGIQLFPKATIWMQKNDFAYFVGDGWQKGASHAGLEKQDVLKIIQANLDGRLNLVNGDSLEIIPGIRVFIGSKHTFESQYLLVNSSTDKVLIASDDCWYYYNLDQLLPVPLTFDTNAYATQLKRMKTLVTDTRLIIPGHDALVLTRFRQVADGVVRIR